MGKRISCGLVMMVLTLAIFFLAAPPVYAASELTTSEAAVQYIKDWEGFSPVAFWDVSQWTIGYGTSGVKGQTMTETEADKAMRDHLKLVDNAINAFAATYNLNLTQAQHDALASFSYNCGVLWMRSDGRFRRAVISGAGSNDFLFAISLWANVSGYPDGAILKRRMSEANIYLNGVYTKSMPSEFSYVIFDPNGGIAGHGGEDKMQGYLAGSNVEIKVADPVKTGYLFAGWFTAKEGGSRINQLTSAKPSMLYAQWGAKVTMTQDANIRSGAGVSYSVVGSAKKGQELIVTATKTVSGAVWGQFEGGWVALMYTDFQGAADEPQVDTSTAEPIAGGKVTCDTYVNVRKGAGTNYPVVATEAKGASVSLYEYTTVSGRKWGLTAKGWICMDYVTLDGSPEATKPETTEPTTAPAETEPTKPAETQPAETKPTVTLTGTVNTNGLNVRKAAGVASPKAATLNQGAKVTVYEQITKDSAPWGRIDQGWVCMYYIDLDNQTSTDSKPSETAIASGTVSSTTGLNVRSGPGTENSRVASLNPGAKVSIYEEKTVSGLTWGRIGEKRWICLQYVTLDKTVQTDTVKPTEPAKPAEPTAPTTPAKPAESAVTGKVTSHTALNVRTGPGTSYKADGMLNPGASVTVYEQKTASGLAWGRIGENRWVCMSYITLDTQGSTGSAAAEGEIKSQTALNVRSGPGLSYPRVGSLNPGDKVKIYETKAVNGTLWGRCDKGWLCTDYVGLYAGSLS